MNRHDFIRRSIIFAEMEKEAEKAKKEKKEGELEHLPIAGGAKGVRLLGPDDEGWS